VRRILLEKKWNWMLRSESKRPAISETKEILPEKVPVEEVCNCLKLHTYPTIQSFRFNFQS
jgi:hypothetical protein